MKCPQNVVAGGCILANCEILLSTPPVVALLSWSPSGESAVQCCAVPTATWDAFHQSQAEASRFCSPMAGDAAVTSSSVLYCSDSVHVYSTEQKS